MYWCMVCIFGIGCPFWMCCQTGVCWNDTNGTNLLVVFGVVVLIDWMAVKITIYSKPHKGYCNIKSCIANSSCFVSDRESLLVLKSFGKSTVCFTIWTKMRKHTFEHCTYCPNPFHHHKLQIHIVPIFYHSIHSHAITNRIFFSSNFQKLQPIRSLNQDELFAKCK